MMVVLAVALKIAVLDLHATGVPPALAQNLSAVLTAEVARQPDVRVISTSDIASMLGFEQQKQALACNDDSGCLAEIGGALGVDEIVTGQLGQVEQTYLLSLQLIDIHHAKVDARTQDTVEGKAAPLIAAIRRRVPELLSHLPPPPPEPGTPRALNPAALSPAPVHPERGRGTRLAAWRVAAWSGGAAAVLAAAAGVILKLQANAAFARYRTAVGRADVAAARGSTVDLDGKATFAFALAGVGATVGGTGLIFSF